MSDTSTLSELAEFVGQSRLASQDQAVARRQALATITRGLQPQRRSRKVVELLGAVLALSARTRRMVMPPVAVDLDVFSPNGSRAVRLTLGKR